MIGKKKRNENSDFGLEYVFGSKPLFFSIFFFFLNLCR